MAYVDASLAAEGTKLPVDLKGTLNPAKVVKLPFYKRQVARYRSQEPEAQEPGGFNSYRLLATVLLASLIRAIYASCPPQPIVAYLESHEWHKLDGDTVTIGITHIAADELTDITYVALPKVGDEIDANGRFGEIESVKATSELYSGVAAR